MEEQTFEGYAARHSKLTKSVTFNRSTLESPPYPYLESSPASPSPSFTSALPSSTELPSSHAPQGFEEFYRERVLQRANIRKINEEETFTDVMVEVKHVITKYMVRKYKFWDTSWILEWLLTYCYACQ